MRYLRVEFTTKAESCLPLEINGGGRGMTEAPVDQELEDLKNKTKGRRVKVENMSYKKGYVKAVNDVLNVIRNVRDKPPLIGSLGFNVGLSHCCGMLRIRIERLKGKYENPSD